MIYEFCAENFTNVPAAIAAGAGRIELCDNLAVGGTTPSAGVVSKTVEYAHAHGARVMCMIRPRGGDFVCSEDELQMMEVDLDLAINLGVDGIVFGCLAPKGSDSYKLDKPAIDRILDAASEAARDEGNDHLDITFHMAFDALDPEDQFDAIDYLAAHGVTRILTHGGVAGTDIFDNLDRLHDLAAYAGGRLIILPGAGINFGNRDAIAGTLECPELHGTKIVDIA